MPDLFDELDAPSASPTPTGDLFDEIAPEKGFLERTAEALESSRQAMNSFLPDLGGSVARGATSEGVLMGSEGIYRGAASTVANANPLETMQKKRADLEQGLANLESGVKQRGFEMPDDSRVRQGMQQEIQDTDIELSKYQVQGSPEQLAQSPQGEATRQAVAQTLEMAANDAAELRAKAREALPVSEAFQQSIVGQVAQGLGQLATLPAYAVPGLGQVMAVGQLYQEGYDDAVQSGATPEQADLAAKQYLSVSAPLEILADKLLVGKALKAMKGKVTVGQATKEIAKQFAQEGGTEGTQQLWLNAVQKELSGIDPDRPLDEGVYTSVLVGGLVGGISAAGAQGAGAVSRKEEVRNTIKTEAQSEIITTADAVADRTQAIAPASAEALRIKARQNAVKAGEEIDKQLDDADKKLQEQEDKEREDALKALQESVDTQEEQFAPPIVEQAPVEEAAPEVIQEAPAEQPAQDVFDEIAPKPISELAPVATPEPSAVETEVVQEQPLSAPPQKMVAAAYLTPDGVLFTGIDHMDADMKAGEAGVSVDDTMAGFVNADGKFFNREDAYKAATGQINPEEDTFEEGKLHTGKLSEPFEGTPSNEIPEQPPVQQSQETPPESAGATPDTVVPAEDIVAGGEEAVPPGGEGQQDVVESPEIQKAKTAIQEAPPKPSGNEEKAAVDYIVRTPGKDHLIGKPVIEVVRTMTGNGSGEGRTFQNFVTIKYNGKQVWRDAQNVFDRENPMGKIFQGEIISIPSNKKGTEAYILNAPNEENLPASPEPAAVEQVPQDTVAVEPSPEVAGEAVAKELPEVGDTVTWQAAGREASATVERIGGGLVGVDYFGYKTIPIGDVTLSKKSSRRIAKEKRAAEEAAKPKPQEVAQPTAEETFSKEALEDIRKGKAPATWKDRTDGRNIKYEDEKGTIWKLDANYGTKEITLQKERGGQVFTIKADQREAAQEVPKPKEPVRVQLRTGPQTYRVEETLPQSAIEKQNGEQYFRVTNERTGASEVIEEKDIARTVKPKSEAVKKKVKSLPKSQQAKAEKSTEVDTSPDPYQGTPLTDAPPLEVEDNLPLIEELSELGVFDENTSTATVLQAIVDSKTAQDWQKILAKRLLALNPEMEIEAVNRPDSSWAAIFSRIPTPLMQINLARRHSGGVMPAILHETSHLATLAQIANPENLKGEAKKAYDDLVKIFQEIQSRPEFQGEYGASSVEEMVAEAFSNAGFRAKLDRIKSGNTTLWQKIVNAIARILFNKPVSPTSLLERSIENAFTLAGAPVIESRSGTSTAMAESGSWPSVISNPNASDTAEAKALVEATQELSEAEVDLAPLTPEQQDLLKETDTFKPLGITAFFAREFGNIPGTDFNDRQSEAVQGLVKAARNYNPESGVPFFKYANGVIRNHMKDYSRSRKVRNKYVKQDSPVMEDDESETIVSTAPSPQDISIQENDRKRMQDVAKEALQAVMAKASERDQKILKGYASGMTLREVAAEVGLSAEGVKKTLTRYRESVEKALFLRNTSIEEILDPADTETEPAIPSRKTTSEDENEYIQSESRLQSIIDEISLPGATSERESVAEALREEQDRQEAEGISSDEESDLTLAASPASSSNNSDSNRLSQRASDFGGFGVTLRPDSRYSDPNLETPLSEIVGEVAAGSPVVARYEQLLRSLGVGTYSNNEGAVAVFNPTPERIVLSIDPSRFRSSNAQAHLLVERVLSEEFIHILDSKVLQERYLKEDTSLPFNMWASREMKVIMSDILGYAQNLPSTERDSLIKGMLAALKVYDPTLEVSPGLSGLMEFLQESMQKNKGQEVVRYMHELARMLVQQERDGSITEKTRNDVMGIIEEWFSKAFDYIKQLSGMVTKGGLKDSELGRFVQDILDLAERVDPKDRGNVAPMAEQRPAVPKKAQEEDIQKLIDRAHYGEEDIRDEAGKLSLEEVPDPVETQVMGQKFTVEGRQRLNPAYQQAAVDHAKSVFDEAGLQVAPNEFVDSSGQLRQTWKLADDFAQEEEAGQRLLELLKRELANQNNEGAADNAVLIDSIRGNFRDTEAFTQNLRNQLFRYAQGEASMRGIRLRALAGIGKSVTDVAKHIPVYLNKIYHDAFNGEAIDSVLAKFRKNLQEIFGNEEVDRFLADEPAFQDVLEKLLRTAKKRDTGSKKGLVPTLKEILHDILTTPFYSQEDIYDRFKNRLEQEFNLSPELSTKAQRFLKLSLQKKFKKAKERALEKTRKSLTPQEKKVMGPKSPLWQKIVQAANAGLFDAPTVLQNIAEQAGWKVPTAEQIAKLKELAGQEQKMRELSEEEKAKTGDDPEALKKAEREKAAATLNKRSILKKQMQQEWAKFATPRGSILSAEGWGPEARKARARMINEFTSANLLTTPGFFVKQMIDVATQWAVHMPTRAIASAMVNRQNDLKQGNPTQFWKDAMDAMKSASKNQVGATRALASTLKQTLRGKTEARNVDALFSSTSVFDRMEELADKLWEKGDPASKGKAISLRILNLLRVSYRFAQALDMMQGNQAEAQEMHEQVIEQLRENGMNGAEAKQAADEVMGDVNAEWLDAINRAKNIFDANGINASPEDVSVAAWEIVKSRQYARMAVAGLDADTNKQYNYLLKNTLGWNEAEEGGLGGLVIAAPLKGARKLGEQLGLPVPIALFGNAIATAVNRTLSASGAGLVPQAFQGSPWFAGEKNKAQRKAEAAIGATLGVTLFGLALAGVLRVRNGWPDDEEEKQTFELEGHRPGTVEIMLGDGQFVPISLSSGPLGLIRPWLAAAGAIQDAFDKQEKAKGRAQGRADKSGAELRFRDLTMTDYLSIAKTAAVSAALQGRTSGGLVGQFSDQGALSLKKGAASVITPVIPFLPGVSQIQRMRGANIDPKKADLSQLLFPTPNSSAQRTNSLGDNVTNLNAIQRISQTLTGGTYPWFVDERSQTETKPYNLIYRSGYVPPSLTEGTYRNINGELRKLTPDEVTQYYKTYGKEFKEDLEGVPESLPPTELRERLQEAHERSRDSALEEVGVEVE